MLTFTASFHYSVSVHQDFLGYKMVEVRQMVSCINIHSAKGFEMFQKPC